MLARLRSALDIDWRALAVALAIGGAGGGLFAHWNLPLPWMIGALVATTATAIAHGVVYPPPARPLLRVPLKLRNAMLVIVGIMLGGAFDPGVAGAPGAWLVSLLGLALYVPLALVMGFVYLRRAVGFDPITAYFTAAPGGLAELTFVGAAAGGDERRIALAHSIRIMLVVMILPFWLQLAWGYVPGARASLASAAAGIGPLDLALLTACALGLPLARRLRLPAAHLTGPMLLSAAVHLLGWTDSAPPAALVAAAQVVIGAAIGMRFGGVRPAFVLRMACVSAGLTVLLAGLAIAFVAGLGPLTGLDRLALLLAYAPGGVAEMSLVALAMDVDPGFVATHHVVRIGLIVLLVPLTFRWLRPRLTGVGSA